MGQSINISRECGHGKDTYHPRHLESYMLYVVKTKYGTHKRFFQISHQEPHEITLLEGKNDMKRKNQFNYGENMTETFLPTRKERTQLLLMGEYD